VLVFSVDSANSHEFFRCGTELAFLCGRHRDGDCRGWATRRDRASERLSRVDWIVRWLDARRGSAELLRRCGRAMRCRESFMQRGET
jgi:hypothetical protein